MSKIVEKWDIWAQKIKNQNITPIPPWVFRARFLKWFLGRPTFSQKNKIKKIVFCKSRYWHDPNGRGFHDFLNFTWFHPKCNTPNGVSSAFFFLLMRGSFYSKSGILLFPHPRHSVVGGCFLTIFMDFLRKISLSLRDGRMCDVEFQVLSMFE